MIPIIIAVVVVATVGAGVTVAALNWDKIFIALKGKKLAVLGEKRVGKTSLIKFLTTGSISREYDPTDYAREVTTGHRFQLRELDLAIKNLKDLSGGQDKYRSWKSAFNDADIVLYLLRVDKLMAGDKSTEVRVREDMGQIRRWLRDQPSPYGSERKNWWYIAIAPVIGIGRRLSRRWQRNKSKSFPLFIIGTHCDLTDPDLTTLRTDQIGDYQDKVRQLSIFQTLERLGGGRGKVTLICGSLKSEATTEALVYCLFKQIEEEI